MTALQSPCQTADSRGGLGDEVGTYVRDFTLTGVLKPGTKTDQEAVGQPLSVSRSPIREALIARRNEGLLDEQGFWQ